MIEKSTSHSKSGATRLPDVTPVAAGGAEKISTQVRAVTSLIGRPVSCAGAAKPSAFPVVRGIVSVNDMLLLQTQRMDTVERLLNNDKISFPDPGAHKALASLRLQMSTLTPTGKDFKKCEKKLIALLDAYLVPEPPLPTTGQGLPSRVQPQTQRKRAKVLYREAVVQTLNGMPWNKIERRFDLAQKNGHVTYTSRMTPAGQMKLGKQSIFAQDYAGQGVSSGSNKDTMHAANLWISEFHAGKPADVAAVTDTTDAAVEQLLFRGIRHAICSAYGLKNETARAESALNRTREVVTAALFLDPDKLQRALRGHVVDLKISSTSLVTATNFLSIATEGRQFDEQREAFRKLSSASPCVLQVSDDRGILREVRVNLKIAAFNFGVNEMAVIFKAGWGKSDRCNLQGLQRLLGENLKPGQVPGGWVGEYLAQPNSAKNAALVNQLSEQIREIWQRKSHRSDGGEPYKLAQRIALLSNEIGIVPCYNCKSGKDRTGMLDAELKRELVQLHGGEGLSVPGEKLTSAKQQIFQQVLANSGNLEIQIKNTGAPGNKVMLDHPLIDFRFSERRRVGDAEAVSRFRGLSYLV